MTALNARLGQLIQGALDPSYVDDLGDLHDFCVQRARQLSAAQWESIARVANIYLSEPKLDALKSAFACPQPSYAQENQAFDIIQAAFTSMAILTLGIDRGVQMDEALKMDQVPLIGAWLTLLFSYLTSDNAIPHSDLPELIAKDIRIGCSWIMSLASEPLCRNTLAQKSGRVLLHTLIDCSTWIAEASVIGRDIGVAVNEIGEMANAVACMLRYGPGGDVLDSMSMMATMVCLSRVAELARATTVCISKDRGWTYINGYYFMTVLDRIPGFRQETFKCGIVPIGCKWLRGRILPNATMADLCKAVFFFESIHWQRRGILAALNARLLVTVIRLLIARSRATTSSASIEQDLPGRLRQELYSILRTFRAYAHFPSLRSAFRKSIRNIDRLLLEENFTLPPDFLALYVEIIAAVEDGAKQEVPSQCINQKCPLRMGDAVSSKIRLFRCGGCQSADYCSIACQRMHWKHSHRKHCKPIRLARERNAAGVPAASCDVAAAHAFALQNLRPEDIIPDPEGIIHFDIPDPTLRNTHPKDFLRLKDEFIDSEATAEHLRGIIEVQRIGGAIPIVITVENKWMVDISSTEKVCSGEYEPQVFSV
ncbi:hypothetical protein CYLTODRAFT_487949 [Cylindrobasidium torrendii FP15055 ss-10]|uniref:MYND-type domain-containing protein n=1 Tax=Cylindrobasidium torrendii FP15055 ss-10 TaxID=1314674 RepID=A0A0D7BKN8_9AGAR|nr:hypothetical protein CYLTODRAFT_487949 [Cylindrobasidium torrendii FP15055 ss-10]